MSSVLGLPVGTIDAQNLALGEAVECKNIVVLHTPHRHLVVFHNIQQLIERVHLLAPPLDLCQLPLHYFSVLPVIPMDARR